jgi:drug/metabolite transporter (DMT)-like permease
MTGETRSLDLFGAATILTLSVIWGLNPIVFKTALAEVGPQSLSGIRCAIGCLCIIVYAWVTKRAIFRVDGTEILGILLGLIYLAQYFALFESLRWTALSHSALFLYVAPLLIAFGTTFLSRNERLRPLQWMGLSLAFLGVVSEFSRRWGRLTSSRRRDGASRRDALGGFDALDQGNAARPRRACEDRFLSDRDCRDHLSLRGLGVGRRRTNGSFSINLCRADLARGGIVGITYALWIWLLGRYPAAQLSAFGYVTPLTGVAVATLFVGEPLSDDLVVAVALVTAGLVLVEWPPRRVFSPRSVRGSTAPSPLRSCISLATPVFSGVRGIFDPARSLLQSA